MYLDLPKILKTTSRWLKSSYACGLLLVVIALTTTSIKASENQSNCNIDDQCIEENTLHLGLSVGMGLRTNPLFESSNIPLILLPQLSFYSGNFFIDNLDVGYTLYQSQKTSLNLIATPSFDSVFFNRWDPGNVFVEVSSGNSLVASPPPTGDFESDRETQINPDELSKREFSYLGGVEFSADTKHGLLQISFLNDITSTHSGKEVRFAYAHSLTNRLTATFGVTWKDAQMTDYYYGVDANEIVDDRAAYQANASFNPFIRTSYINKLNNGDSWRFSFEYQQLDSEITDSPISSDDYVVTFFVGKTFNF